MFCDYELVALLFGILQIEFDTWKQLDRMYSADNETILQAWHDESVCWIEVLKEVLIDTELDIYNRIN